MTIFHKFQISARENIPMENFMNKNRFVLNVSKLDYFARKGNKNLRETAVFGESYGSTAVFFSQFHIIPFKTDNPNFSAVDFH